MSLSKALELPVHWKTYYANVKDRCKDLVRYKIWNGLDVNRLEVWMKNFNTDSEKYLSACILDSLMYRSNSMTKSLIYHLFNVVLPNYTRLNPTPIGVINDWFERFNSHRQDPGVRLVSAIREIDPPTKSANFILRLLSKEFNIKDSWIIYPNQMKYHYESGIRTFVFIDDFLGSGLQFSEIILEYNLNMIPESYIIYCPLVAHTTGVEFVEKSFNNAIPIVASEYLNEKMNFFDNFFDNSPENAREFYVKMALEKGIIKSRSDNEFGFGNLQVAYSFEHSCPDNSLNVLWHSSDNWNPLFNK